MLLLIVFGLKAAAFPLYFWLPGSYAAASAPVAALFAIMTKVGVYAMLRVHVLTFGVSGPASALWPDVLLTAALITLTLATIGALAARSLRSLVANLTVASVGTLMITVGMASTGGITAGVYYLVHSTFVVACLFLLAELIAEQRSDRHDALLPGPELSQPTLLGVLFVVGAAGIAGLPPLSGFLGKVGVLLAAPRVDRVELDLGRGARLQRVDDHRARPCGEPAFLEDDTAGARCGSGDCPVHPSVRGRPADRAADRARGVRASGLGLCGRDRGADHEPEGLSQSGARRRLRWRCRATVPAGAE